MILLLLLLLLVLLTTDYQIFMTIQHATTDTTATTDDSAGLLPTGKASLDNRGREKLLLTKVSNEKGHEFWSKSLLFFQKGDPFW